MSALHTPMVSGSYKTNFNSQDDFSTINFIVGIVRGTITSSTSSSTLSTYGMTKTMPQVNSSGWIEGINDDLIELSFALDDKVEVLDMDGNILYSDETTASCIRMQQMDNKIYLSIQKQKSIQISYASNGIINVTYQKAGEVLSQSNLSKRASSSNDLFGLSIENNQMNIQE